ncbi:MAG TPA: hypothetical protein VHT04_16420 [Stellaceae bacterium]|jgi:hypothetical protein|nr:hypothetical protein [Stellaceae bacterium]
MLLDELFALHHHERQIGQTVLLDDLDLRLLGGGGRRVAGECDGQQRGNCQQAHAMILPEDRLIARRASNSAGAHRSRHA